MGPMFGGMGGMGRIPGARAVAPGSYYGNPQSFSGGTELVDLAVDPEAAASQAAAKGSGYSLGAGAGASSAMGTAFPWLMGGALLLDSIRGMGGKGGGGGSVMAPIMTLALLGKGTGLF